MTQSLSKKECGWEKPKQPNLDRKILFSQNNLKTYVQLLWNFLCLVGICPGNLSLWELVDPWRLLSFGIISCSASYHSAPLSLSKERNIYKSCNIDHYLKWTTFNSQELLYLLRIWESKSMSTILSPMISLGVSGVWESCYLQLIIFAEVIEVQSNMI